MSTLKYEATVTRLEGAVGRLHDIGSKLKCVVDAMKMAKQESFVVESKILHPMEDLIDGLDDYCKYLEASQSITVTTPNTPLRGF